MKQQIEMNDNRSCWHYVDHIFHTDSGCHKKINKCLGERKYSIGKFIFVSVFPKSQTFCMCILRKSEWLYKVRKLYILLK